MATAKKKAKPKKQAKSKKPDTPPKVLIKEKNLGGRPTSYRAEYNSQAEKLCKLGATDMELAEFFMVEEQTINNWKIKHPKFFESIKRGKLLADAEVADRLYQRAIGYEHEAVELKVVSLGSGEGSEVQQVAVRKIYPPDATAAIFWLKNRQKEKWRDKGEVDLTSKGEKISNQPYTDDQVDKIINSLREAKTS